MKKSAIIINIILGALLLVFTALFIANGGLFVKSLAGVTFVAIGVVNLLYACKDKTANKFSYIMVIGLFFACLGDIFLEISFIIGAALFAIGHIFFFVSYSSLIKLKLKDLIYGAGLFVACLLFILLAPIFNFGGITMKILCIVYAFVITFMVGKAVSNYIQDRSVQNLIILIGSILFFVSDFMLLLNLFSTIKIRILSQSLFRLLCLITYYPAEFMLAHSIAYNKKQTEK